MKYVSQILLLISVNNCLAQEPVIWKKHTVMEHGDNTSVVAADYDKDGNVDVITSYNGQVSLFLGPDWTEVQIHKYTNKRHRSMHSETLDIDADGDMDWVGVLSNGNPFWLENPGKIGLRWIPRTIDHDIVGIHCILKADVDNDGSQDLIINNFKTEGPIADSVFWLSIPDNLKSAKHWDRHAFADKDAGGGSHYFGFGDLDGDGWGEIAVASKGIPEHGGNWFAYWKNPGKETVKAPWGKQIVAENQIAATNILPGDINGDGKIDFLASRGHGTGVIWFEAPDWKEHVIDAEIKSPHSLVLVDLDGDGDLDGASCALESKRVSIYLNDGKGKFTRTDIDDDQVSYDLRAADMDNDGDLDLLNAGKFMKNVAWYENPSK